MKVKELIKFLEKQDPESRVVVDAYEGGYDELRVVANVCICDDPDNHDTWYMGNFKKGLNGQYDEIAVLLPRTS